MNVNEFKIYVPNYSTSNCAYIYNSDVIRVYDSVPRNNSTVAYKDYYIKSSYIYNEGSTTFSNYTTLPVCINSNRITTQFYYRNDFPMIMITSLAIIMFLYFLISKVVRTAFLGWRWS